MAFTLPPTLTDSLAAVNVLLSSIGESPVSSIEGDISEATEAASALNLLTEVSLAVQSQGWPWNRDYEMVLRPDVTSRIALPDNCLRITKAYPGCHSGSLIERSQAGVRYLYDNRNHSFMFTDAVIVDIISKFAFEDIPEAGRRYITIRAAKQYQGRIQTNLSVDRILEGEVILALRTLEEERDEAEPANQITGNVQTMLSTHGRGVRRRNQ